MDCWENQGCCHFKAVQLLVDTDCKAFRKLSYFIKIILSFWKDIHTWATWPSIYKMLKLVICEFLQKLWFLNKLPAISNGTVNTEKHAYGRYEKCSVFWVLWRPVLDDKVSRIKCTGLFNSSSLKRGVDRLNTTHKLVIVRNVTFALELAWTSLGYGEHSDWANLTFATLSLAFRGHEAGLKHAYWALFPVVWSTMPHSSSIGNYFCFSLIVYATVLVVHFLLQVPKARLLQQN